MFPLNVENGRSMPQITAKVEVLPRGVKSGMNNHGEKADKSLGTWSCEPTQLSQSKRKMMKMCVNGCDH